MDRTPRRAAAAAILTNLRRIVHAIQAQATRIEASVDLTGSQLWALREVNASVHGLAVGEIARRLVLHKATAGRIVERLVEQKLVRSERPANDLRYLIVTVTPRGRSLAERPVGGPPQADLIARVLQLPAGDVERIAEALESLVTLLGAEGAEAGPLFERGSGAAPKRHGSASAPARSRRTRPRSVRE